MLVLSRKLGESIVIPGCGMTITVVGMRGNRVRLGITAPPGVRVDREEVYQRAERAHIVDEQHTEEHAMA